MVLQEEKLTINGSWSPSSQNKLGAKGSRFLQQSRPASQLSDYLMADIYLVIESCPMGLKIDPQTGCGPFGFPLFLAKPTKWHQSVDRLSHKSGFIRPRCVLWTQAVLGLGL